MNFRALEDSTFPFLVIADKYKVEYEDVLMYAWYLHPVRMEREGDMPRPEFVDRIHSVSRPFQFNGPAGGSWEDFVIDMNTALDRLL